jgi:hypothetical protein
MKTIKNLKLLIYILCSFFLIGILANTTFTVLAFIFEINAIPLGYSLENVPNSLKIIALAKLFSVALFSLGLYHLIIMLKVKNIKEYLSNNSFISLNKSGKYIVIAGLIQICLSFSFLIVENKYTMYLGFDLNASLLITIIGFFFVFFSKILVKAVEVKIENDLTI